MKASESKGKSAKATKKSRPENTEPKPSGSPIPPPRSPSKAKKTAKKAERRSAKLTGAQQDIMFEWLEQTPAIYDTNHVDYKKRIQLLGEQAIGEGLDGATLEL